MTHATKAAAGGKSGKLAARSKGRPAAWAASRWRNWLAGIITMAGVSTLATHPHASAEGLPPMPERPGALRVGMIGLDTSHVPAFAGEINRADATGDVAKLVVVAGFPGGSPDVASSRDRVAGFTEQLRASGVKIVDSIAELLPLVDVVMIESVDGRPHLEQARPVIAAGKPLFIDKPLAGSLADALEIMRLAREAKVPCFSSSSLRFSSGIAGMRSDERVGEVLGCVAYSPCSLEEHHPDLFWYGVHGVEVLYTIMGTGCVSLSRTHAEGVDVVTGTWSGGRVATYRGIRAGATDYGALVFGSKGIAPAGSYEGYKPLVAAVAKFFLTGQSPVPAEETLEMFTFMEAADESRRQGGAVVTLESVRQKAEAQRASQAR